MAVTSRPAPPHPPTPRRGMNRSYPSTAREKAASWSGFFRSATGRPADWNCRCWRLSDSRPPDRLILT